METPHPLRMAGGDDASSIVSFEDISRKVGGAKKPSSRGVLKINGKVPDVLHVIKYIGWNDKVVDSKQPLLLQPTQSTSMLTNLQLARALRPSRMFPSSRTMPTAMSKTRKRAAQRRSPFLRSSQRSSLRRQPAGGLVVAPLVVVPVKKTGPSPRHSTRSTTVMMTTTRRMSKISRPRLQTLPGPSCASTPSI